MTAGKAGRLADQRMMDALEAQVGLVRFALADMAPETLAAPVTSCPEWDVHQLVAHLGTAHRWADRTVADADPQERTRGLRDILAGAPTADLGVAPIADWYGDGAAAMLDRFQATDPDAPAWTMDGSGRAGFWLRRQLHETVVHRWDLENAVTPGRETPLVEDVALDGLAEFVEFMAPISAMIHGSPPPATLRLQAQPHAPDGLSVGATPLGSRTTEAEDLRFLVPGAPDAPEVEISGPAESLLLLMWGRIRPDDAHLRIVGDEQALRAVVDRGLAV